MPDQVLHSKSGRAFKPSRPAVYICRPRSLARFACPPLEAGAERAAAMRQLDRPLRAVIAFEVERARTLLADGAPLIAELRGRERVAVAAFAAGGLAALDAIERAGFDVLSGPPRPRRRALALALAASLAPRAGRD